MHTALHYDTPKVVSPQKPPVHVRSKKMLTPQPGESSESEGSEEENNSGVANTASMFNDEAKGWATRAATSAHFSTFRIPRKKPKADPFDPDLVKKTMFTLIHPDTVDQASGENGHHDKHELEEGLFSFIKAEQTRLNMVRDGIEGDAVLTKLGQDIARSDAFVQREEEERNLRKMEQLARQSLDVRGRLFRKEDSGILD